MFWWIFGIILALLILAGIAGVADYESENDNSDQLDRLEALNIINDLKKTNPELYKKMARQILGMPLKSDLEKENERND